MASYVALAIPKALGLEAVTRRSVSNAQGSVAIGIRGYLLLPESEI